MNKPNFIRKIDELGRIVIPIELRKILDIKERDSLEIYLNDTYIYMQKSYPTCVFCNSDVNLKTLNNKNICINCIEKLK